MQAKYLGVLLSEDLSWSNHIEQITKEAMKQTGMIFRRFYIVLTIPKTVISLLCQTMWPQCDMTHI